MKAAPAVENTAETEIGDLIHQWRQAILDHDHDRIAKFYAPDVLAFDAADTLQLKGRDAYRNAWYGGKLAADQDAMDRIHDGVTLRFAREIAVGVVEVHRSTSAEAAGRFPAAYFDWVYVDGNHLYEAVRADLELFDPKLKADGLLAGDDYGLPGWWDDGVTRAVDELVAGGGYEVVTLESNQFLLRKRLSRL